MKHVILAVLALFGMCTMAVAEVGDDGLHKQPWFSVTFKDVAEDLSAAKDEGKRLVILFEQRGCVYCKKLHEQVLSDKEVADYIKANYKVVQYNLYGSEEVTDLDGKTLTEKEAARKWRLNFTPTMLFLPETADGKKSVADAAVATIPGAFGKGTTLDMFQWVRAKGYEGEETFQRYHARRIRERQAKDPNASTN